MTEDITELKFEQLNKDVADIKKQLESLPDIITQRMNENVELKIQNANKDLEGKFYKWITGAYASIIVTLAGVVINYLTK